MNKHANVSRPIIYIPVTANVIQSAKGAQKKPI